MCFRFGWDPWVTVLSPRMCSLVSGCMPWTRIHEGVHALHKIPSWMNGSILERSGIIVILLFIPFLPCNLLCGPCAHNAYDNWIYNVHGLYRIGICCNTPGTSKSQCVHRWLDSDAVAGNQYCMAKNVLCGWVTGGINAYVEHRLLAQVP